MFNPKYVYDEVTMVGADLKRFDYLKVDQTSEERGEEPGKFVIRIYLTDSNVEFVRYGVYATEEEASEVAKEILATIFPE